jgi:hypothetical protein
VAGARPILVKMTVELAGFDHSFCVCERPSYLLQDASLSICMVTKMYLFCAWFGAVEITLPVAIVAAAYIIGQAIGRVFNMVNLLQ